MNLRRRPLWIAFAMLVSLGIAGFSARWLMRAMRVKPVPVAVARHALAQGSRLTANAVSVRDWPGHLLPPGTPVNPEKLEGRVVRAPIAEGLPILEEALAPEGSRGGLSAVITSGHRAMTVHVNEVVGVAGFALPGNFVDVLVNSPTEGARGASRGSISKIVLQHVPVLAVAQDANPDESRPHVVNAVTLEVTPQEAEQLDLARNIGTLSLVLRNQVDPKMAPTPGATRQGLLGLYRAASADPLQPAAEIIRGSERSLLR
ncbi:MAG: Flp pilus assembly protein CpaB [Betaproteobacteria bacterium]|nr:Flp pilus assembly protein CpaB [Betaproteobacteria bacterium]